jgi:hypothetical protein
VCRWTTFRGGMGNGFKISIPNITSDKETGIGVGTRLAVVNSDSVLHNVHAVQIDGPSPITVFNLAMPLKGQRLPAVLKRPGVVHVRCDAGHTWMSAYVRVFEHPYFAVSDARGQFTLEAVPAGEHTVELWHEPVAGKGSALVQTAVVRIVDGQVAKIEPQLSL